MVNSDVISTTYWKQSASTGYLVGYMSVDVPPGPNPCENGYQWFSFETLAEAQKRWDSDLNIYNLYSEAILEGIATPCNPCLFSPYCDEPMTEISFEKLKNEMTGLSFCYGYSLPFTPNL